MRRESSLRTFFLVALAVAVPAAAAAQSRAFQPADHYRLKSAADVQLSPDGSRVAFVERFIDRERNNRSQIWLLTLADGSLRRLSAENADDSSPRWSPDGRAIAFLSGRRGPSETGFLPTAFGSTVAVRRLDRDASETVAEYRVTNHPLAYQGSAEQIAWAPDGSAIAFLSADEGPEGAPGDPHVVTRYGYKSWSGMSDNRRWHIYVVTLADKKVRRLTDGPYQDHSIAWSPKGDEIAYISNHEADPDRVHNYDIFAVRVADGRIRQITKTKGCEYAPTWAPDGASLAYLAGVRPLTTQESSAEDPHVWVIPAAGGAARQLAATLDRRANAVRWAADEPALYFTVQDRGSTILYRTGVDDDNLTAVVAGPGSVSSFTVGPRRTVAYAFGSVTSPAEVFVKVDAREPRQLTTLNAELLAGRDVSRPEAFEFSSFDGTKVQAFLTPPLAREPGRRYPLIVNIHGGPHGQQGPAFVHKSQVYAGAGYAVLMVNYRGSSGYGQKFADGTINDQNGSEFKDVIAGLDHILAKTPYLDPDRLGVEGGSYGGQLTNWAITQTTRFKSAIPSASISNLVSHAYLIWAQDYPQVEWGGRHIWQGDLAKTLWERSALAHVSKVRTPTMFIHGELDQDVPIQEAEQMYVALKQVGVEAVLVRYPREGHGLREPAHVVDAMERSLAWHDRFLKAGSDTTAQQATSPAEPRGKALIERYADYTIGPVPTRFGYDPSFYKKYVDAHGIPVISSEKVPDDALLVARDIVVFMLANRPDIRREMIAKGYRVGVMAETEMTTDIPEQRDRKKPARDDRRLTRRERENYDLPGGIGSMTDKEYWDRRARGLGGVYTTGAEENVLGYPGTRYYGENILVHEWAHGIMSAIRTADPPLHEAIQAAYKEAMARGQYKGHYAETNASEYWAEGTQWWFWSNYEWFDGQTRLQSPDDLKAYDPKLFELLGRVYLGHHIPADVYHAKNIAPSRRRQ